MDLLGLALERVDERLTSLAHATAEPRGVDARSRPSVTRCGGQPQQSPPLDTAIISLSPLKAGSSAVTLMVVGIALIGVITAAWMVGQVRREEAETD